MSVIQRVEDVAHRAEVNLDLSVYEPEALEQIAGALETYLTRERAPRRRAWLPWLRDETATERVSPLLLAGPVGTGKTTLLMLLDRALPEASCAPLFQQSIAAHPSTPPDSDRAWIEVHPLALMGLTRNLPTGVLRLTELQTFHRRFTFDRRTSREDEAAAERFAQLFDGRIVFVDEFVPDVVSSFPMQVINHLADHGVQVVLSSNRTHTPFVEGVRVIPILGEDMRSGELALVCCPSVPDPRFDAFREVPTRSFDHLARGLEGRVRTVEGQRWLLLNFESLAYAAADWLAFHRLLKEADVLLLDRVPLFDPSRGASPDAARRLVLLIDAVYDERLPVLLRLTNAQPLPPDFDVEQVAPLYPPETVVDLERALSRLRQLSALPLATPST